MNLGSLKTMHCPCCHGPLTLRQRCHAFGWEGGVCPHCQAKLQAVSWYWLAPGAICGLGILAFTSVPSSWTILSFLATIASLLALWAWGPIRGVKHKTKQ